LLTVSVIQEALVLSPFTVYLGRFTEQREQKSYAGASLTFQVGLTFAAMVVVLVGATIFANAGGRPQVGIIGWCVLATIPALSMREYARRYLYAHFYAAQVFILDIAVSILQFGGMGLAWYSGWLTPGAALLLIAAASALPATVWFLQNRQRFVAPTRSFLATEFRRHWSFGRWICISQISDLTVTHGIGWLIAAMVGTAATGLFAACNSIVLVLNPLLLGMSSILLPRASQANHRQGRNEVIRIIWKVAGLLTVSGGLLCLLVALNGELLMQVLYSPPTLDGVREIILLLALAGMIGAASHAFDNGLLVINRPEVNRAAAVSGLVMTFVIAFALTPAYGVIGTAWGVVAGTLMASAYQIVGFTRLAGRPNFLAGDRAGEEK
jgi:O-antigen/teichoic acid export membrane protein